jgi:hypothetical protein
MPQYVPLIMRGCIAHISPVLLANRKDWRNLHHALGHPPTATLFTPTSVATNEMLPMLKELLPDFVKEHFDFCVTHCARRNAELHSGEEAFAGLGTSEWLPKYYASCQVLLRSMGKGLDDLFDDPKAAAEMIESLQDKAAKAVERDIKEHQKVWQGKSPDEQKTALAQAITWAERHAGHRAACPACKSPSLVRGSRQGAVTTDIGEDMVVQKQTMLPSSFECIACGLKISGLSKLSASGLGDAFTSTSTFSPAEFFNLHTDEELEEARAMGSEPEWEEDYND